MPRLRTFSALVLKLALSAGLIWFAFSRIDVSSAWTSMRAMPAAFVVAAIGLLYLQMLLGAARFAELLAHLGAQVGLRRAFDAVLIGAFFSQTFISFVGGDAMRIWHLTRERVALGAAAQGVLFDRVAGFGGIVLVVAAAMPFALRRVDSAEMRLGLVSILLVIAAGILVVLALRWIPRALRRWKLLELLQQAVAAGMQIAASRRRALRVLGLSVAIQCISVLILYVLARGLGIEVPIGEFFVLMPVVLFLSLLPISFAGWGVREGAMVAALGLVGVPAQLSLALSICFGLCLIAASLPGALLWLASRRAARAGS